MGLHKWLYAIFLRLDSYYLEHATLLVEDYENIIDIFRFWINKNDNLLRSRKIEQSEPDDSTNCSDMNNWKPIVQNIMQQFVDYDNEG